MKTETLARAMRGEPLYVEEVQQAFEDVLSGGMSDVRLAALLAAMAARGETAEELAAAAATALAFADRVQPTASVLVDTCGTGGDGAGLINVSTLAALVVAACDYKVAKHGNRSVSSKCGSADLLEGLGVRLEQSSSEVAASIERVGIGFLFAPSFNQAMRHAAPVRRELKVRTLFNLLGPLINPAPVTHQLLGVYHESKQELVAQALLRLKRKGAWVVCGEGGVDEVSLAGATAVVELRDGVVRRFSVTPEDFGIRRAPLEAIRGGGLADNIRIARSVLEGEEGPFADAVVLNAAATLCVVQEDRTPEDAAIAARAQLASGEAKRKLEAWVTSLSPSCTQERVKG